MVAAGNKAKCLSLFNHTTKAIHHYSTKIHEKLNPWAEVTTIILIKKKKQHFTSLPQHPGIQILQNCVTF